MRKIVFLLCNEFDNVALSLPTITESIQNGANLRVIALDTLAAREARRRGVPCKTAGEYLKVDNDDEMMSAAVNYAQTWYLPFAHGLCDDEIRLGEMVESQVVALFIAAIRCGTIASAIMTQETPDEIVVPQQPMAKPPYSFAYGLLPDALECLAAAAGIKVTKARPRLRARLRSTVASTRAGFVGLVFSVTTTIFTTYSAILSARAKKRGKNVITSSCVPDQHLVENALSKQASEWRSLYPVCLSQYLLKISLITPRRLTAQFSALWSAVSANGRLQERLTYHELPLFEILRRPFEALFCDEFPALIMFTTWARKTIDRLRPDALVLMEDSLPLHRTLCSVCKRLRIPVLMLQHGAYADEPKLPIMPFCADKQAVWGPISRAWHVQRGKTPQSQVVTGNYRFDAIATGYPVEKDAFCQMLGLSPFKPIVVVATSWFANSSVRHTPESQERYVAQTLEALKQFDEIQVVVKLHPTFHERYREIAAAIAREVGARVVITKDYLRELLSICDLLICDNSTVGLEAMILGKPVLSNNTTGVPELLYGRYGAALVIHKAEDIAPAIDALLNKPEQREEVLRNARKFVQDYAYLQDGHASKRVADLIIRMAQGEP